MEHKLDFSGIILSFVGGALYRVNEHLFESLLEKFCDNVTQSESRRHKLSASGETTLCNGKDNKHLESLARSADKDGSFKLVYKEERAVFPNADTNRNV